MASLATGVARKGFKELHGIVLTAGLMQKTVKVQVPGKKWNKFLQKVPFPFAFRETLFLLSLQTGYGRTLRSSFHESSVDAAWHLG